MVIYWIGIALVWASWLVPYTLRRRIRLSVAIVGDVLVSAYAVVTRDWILLTTAMLFIAFLIFRWWRRGGKRAMRHYGAKSWARLMAVVSKAREAYKPRRTLRPVLPTS